ncbi:MAG: sugar-binding domain-containing protein, partial [Armatimonadota bacterium]
MRHLRCALLAHTLLCCAAAAAAAGTRIQLDAPPPRTRDTLVLEQFDGPGHVPAGAEIVDGRFGPALELSGDAVITYRAAESIDLNQGTIELWLNPQWGPAHRGTSRYFVWHPTADWNDPAMLRLWYWSTSDTGGVLRFDHHAVAPGGSGFVFTSWPGNGWHHIAARWHHRDGIALYVDGRKAAGKLGTWDPLPTAEGVVQLSDSEHPADAAFDALRIRSEPAWSPEESPVLVTTGEAAAAPEGDAGVAPVRVVNRRDTRFSGRLRIAVRDYFGAIVRDTTRALRIPPFSEHRETVRFPVQRPGRYFRIGLQIDDGKGHTLNAREDIVTVSCSAGPRRAVCLDGEWERADGAWGELSTPDDGWRPVLLPRKAASFPTHLRWYRRRFSVPADIGDRVRLVPLHVKQRAQWWVNGSRVGDSEYAYVPYSFDITGAVRRGEPNEIVVAVTDWVDCAQPDL